jgi:hypothetical protein
MQNKTGMANTKTAMVIMYRNLEKRWMNFCVSLLDAAASKSDGLF